MQAKVLSCQIKASPLPDSDMMQEIVFHCKGGILPVKLKLRRVAS